MEVLPLCFCGLVHVHLPKKVITRYHRKWYGMEMDGNRNGEMDGEIETKWKKWKSSVNWFTG